MNLGIYLERNFERENDFTRTWSDILGEVDSTTISTLNKEDIFVFKQVRRPITTPTYRRFIVSMKRLQNSRFEFHEATPPAWFCRGDRFELNPPYSFSGHPFCGKLYSAFEFSELNSDQGFAVILKQTVESVSEVENLCEPSATIVERLPDLDSSRFKSSFWPLKTSFLQWSFEFETPLNFRTGRISWQHPVRKWWIKVSIKKEMVDLERAVVIYIDWHPPEQIETSDTE